MARGGVDQLIDVRERVRIMGERLIQVPEVDTHYQLANRFLHQYWVGHPSVKT